MTRRTIKQQADYAEKKILEDNSEFYDEIIAQNFDKKSKKIKRMFLFSVPAIAAVAALVLCLVFLLPSAETQPAKKYLLENESEQTEINLSEVNNDLSGIVLDIDSSYEYTIKRFYDSQYGDTLYYQVLINKLMALEDIKLFVYVNPDYERQQQIKENYEKTTTTIGDFSVVYGKQLTEEFGLFMLSYFAETEYNGVRFYMEFEQYSLDEIGSFFSFFEQTIKKT